MRSRAEEIKVIRFWRRMGHSELSVVAPGDLDGYYRSIEHPFWVAWRAISRRDDPTGIFLVGFLLCFVPIIPFLASVLVGIIYGKPTIHVWRLRFEPSSFWLWWPALASVSFLLSCFCCSSEGRRAGLPNIRFNNCHRNSCGSHTATGPWTR